MHGQRGPAVAGGVGLLRKLERARAHYRQTYRGGMHLVRASRADKVDLA